MGDIQACSDRRRHSPGRREAREQLRLGIDFAAHAHGSCAVDESIIARPPRADRAALCITLPAGPAGIVTR
jgi:hypothetical protein